MSDNLKNQFEMSDPSASTMQVSKEEMFKEIEAAERWARNERLNVAHTVQENREAWLNEERQKVALERQTPSLDLNPPSMPQKPIEQEAQERVSHKIQGMMAAIETERSRRIEEITQLPHATHMHAPEAVTDKPKRTPAEPEKKLTHSAIDQAFEKSANIHAQYEHNRAALIQNAQMQRIPDPEGAVKQALHDQLDGARKALHKQVHYSWNQQKAEQVQTQERTGPKMSG